MLVSSLLLHAHANKHGYITIKTKSGSMYDLISLTTRRQIFALLAIFLSCLMTAVHAEQELISVFPLDNYNQTVDRWIKPDEADYEKPLISSEVQQQRMNEFYQHYFGESSPWNADYVNHVVKQAAPDDLQTLEKILIGNYSNKNKSGNEIGYGENFRPHTQGWIHAIAANINLSQFDNSTYHANQRGIAIDNLHVRVLPSEDVHFYHHKLAGQGYPFDNLQMSSLWAGTPVYIIGESRDRAWSFVLTPDFIGWVKSKGIVRTSDAFVRQWQAAAKAKSAAITQTQVSLIDNKNQYLLTVYVGSVFPATGDENNIKLMIPAAGFDHQAVIKDASVKAGQAAIMPLAATPHHFANLMRTMIGRPYGWGGMYFYNDCSAELKSLFTPFGIWLPRHSSDQVMRGRMVDVSSYSQSERLAYLKRT